MVCYISIYCDSRCKIYQICVAVNVLAICVQLKFLFLHGKGCILLFLRSILMENIYVTHVAMVRFVLSNFFSEFYLSLLISLHSFVRRVRWNFIQAAIWKIRDTSLVELSYK